MARYKHKKTLTQVTENQQTEVEWQNKSVIVAAF
jgi:hypothetical protein